MPLNQSQRNEIEKSISHFFYGLATTQDELTQEITALRQALDKGLIPPPKPQKPSEEKEREEKHANTESAFTQLTKVIQEIESSIKGLEDRNQESRITLHEAIEYIIFYCICRLQFHMQFLAKNEEPEDDFKINEWLLPNITPAEAGEALSETSEENLRAAFATKPWQLQKWLSKKNARDAMKMLGWDADDEKPDQQKDKNISAEALAKTKRLDAAEADPVLALEKKPWRLDTWLHIINAKAAMQTLGWNLDTTFGLLQKLPNKPFETYKPPVDYGSYNFNWELPKLNNRMYTAEIKERWVQPKNKAGKVISCTPYIDLHIVAHLSRHKKFEKVLPAFKPYPNVPIFDRDTPRVIEQKFLAAEEVIKSAAKTIAEKEAITLIVGHLENLDHVSINSEAQLREHSLSSAKTEILSYDDDEMPFDINGEMDIENDVVELDASEPVVEPIQAAVNAAPVPLIQNSLSSAPPLSSPMSPRPLNRSTRFAPVSEEIQTHSANLSTLFRRIPPSFGPQQSLHSPPPFNLDSRHVSISGEINSPSSDNKGDDVSIYDLDYASAHGAQFSPIPIEDQIEEQDAESSMPISELDIPRDEYSSDAAALNPMQQSTPSSQVRIHRNSTPVPSNMQRQRVRIHGFHPNALPSSRDATVEFDAESNDQAPVHQSPSNVSMQHSSHVNELDPNLSLLFSSDDQPDEAGYESAENRMSGSNSANEDRPDFLEPLPVFNAAPSQAESNANADIELPASFGADLNALAAEFSDESSVPVAPANQPSAHPEFESPDFFLRHIDAVQAEVDALLASLGPAYSSNPPMPPSAIVNSDSLRMPQLVHQPSLVIPPSTHASTHFHPPGGVAHLLLTGASTLRSAAIKPPPLPIAHKDLAVPNTLSTVAIKPPPLPIVRKDAVATPPGLVLVTHAYYYEEIKADRMSLAGLDTFSPAEVENLISEAVIMFQKLHLLDRSVAMGLKPGFRRLLETPAYSIYFRLHPETIVTAMNVTPEAARRLASPYLSNLLEREKYSLEYLLALTLEELTVACNAIYGELFYRLNDTLPLIKGITVAEQNFLLDDTVRGMVEKGLLPIPAARALISGHTALAPFQLDLIRDPACRGLFLQSRLSHSTLHQISPAQAVNLRDPQLIALIEANILPLNIGMNLTPEQAANLRDPKIIELIKNNVLPLNDGMNITPEKKRLYLIRGIYKFLLEKILTPLQTEQLSPMMRVIVNTEPYTTILAKKPEFIGILQGWSEMNLQRLFAPTILELFTKRLLSLEHLRNPVPNFFAILNGKNICQLLIDKKISLPQALRLTSPTWMALEYDPKITRLIRKNTDNNQQFDYLPIKIWGYRLSQRLFDFYRNKPQKFESITDTLDILRTQFEDTANGEDISKAALTSYAVKLLLRDIRDEIEMAFRSVSERRKPAVYRLILDEINRAADSRHPDWLNTLSHLARYAAAGLADNPRIRETAQARDYHRPQRQNFFREPYEMTNSGIRFFCHNILAITALTDYQMQHTMQTQFSNR